MKTFFIISLIVFLGIAGQVSSNICKCGLTSLDYSCCSHNSLCTTNFLQHHKCQTTDQVDKSLCTKSTPFCKKNTGDLEVFDDDNSPIIGTDTPQPQNNMCQCGAYAYSASCCQDDSFCKQTFFVHHCPTSKRVQGCDKKTTPYCKKQHSSVDNMYSNLIEVDVNQKEGVCKCGLSRLSYSCCFTDSQCQVSFLHGHHCKTEDRVDMSQCTNTTHYCNHKKTLDQETQTKLHMMNEMAQNNEWFFENQEKVLESQ